MGQRSSSNLAKLTGFPVTYRRVSWWSLEILGISLASRRSLKVIEGRADMRMNPSRL